MIMARMKTWRKSVADEGGLYAWFNTRMVQKMGPAQVGPYTEVEPLPESRNVCPLCGAPMTEHDVDRSGERTMLHCPGR